MLQKATDDQRYEYMGMLFHIMDKYPLTVVEKDMLEQLIRIALVYDTGGDDDVT